MHREFVGKVGLHGRALGEFQKVTFELPDAIVTALSKTYSDLRFVIILDVPWGKGSYLLDDFQLERAEDSRLVDAITPNGEKHSQSGS